MNSVTFTQLKQPRPKTGWARFGKSYEILGPLPFVLSHIAVLGVFWSGITVSSVICCIVLYLIRMFGVTGGYHRYFSHRTFKTSRVMQFLLAFLAQTSAQRGALWWAAHHRQHHKYSDTEEDVHSPRIKGFWYAHLGWIFDNNSETDYAKVRDLAKFPELMFLNKVWLLPPILLGFAVWWFLSWPGLFVGFFLSTVFLWHGTFLVNSLAHIFGRRRYPTEDDSRNSLLIALLTLGEGWHNNHHYYMHSTRQGFFWWEIDITYYIIRMFAWLGLVWDIKEPPQHLVRSFEIPGVKTDAEPVPEGSL